MTSWRRAGWLALVAAVVALVVAGGRQLLQVADLHHAQGGLGWAVAALGAGFLGGIAAALAWPQVGMSAARSHLARRLGCRRGWRVVLYGAAATATCSALVSCGGAAPYATLGTQEIPFSMIVTGLVGAGAGAFVGTRAGGRLRAMGHSLDLSMLRRSAWLLPSESRLRWLEEWQVELAQIPTFAERAAFSLSLLMSMPRIGVTLRLPSRRRWRD